MQFYFLSAAVKTERLGFLDFEGEMRKGFRQYKNRTYKKTFDNKKKGKENCMANKN